jgi:cell wall-associated NlpC family hydrolase
MSGDIIFFDWEQDGVSDHVGIVEYVEGEVVHTVEGNTSNSVARRSYRLAGPDVIGYGAPTY